MEILNWVGEEKVLFSAATTFTYPYLWKLWERVEIWKGEGKKGKSIQGLYSFYTYVLPKTGYPAVVLCVDVATPTGEGEGEEGGGRRGRGGSGGLGGDGGGGGQGWVGGEGRPASSWESGIGYRLEGRRVYGGVDPATLGAGRLDVVMVVGDEGRGGVDDGEGSGVGGSGGDGVEEGGGRGLRSLSFRLETGRSPKNRMHLTEGRQEFRKCSSGE